ncbi:MAG: thioesterase family protein, partial [Actinobacteria bacterium]
MSEALYLRDGGAFLPTDYTTSPWSSDHCHGGPPAALLARAVQEIAGADLHLARITVEMLGPIPKHPVVATAGVVRPGKKVRLASAELATTAGDVLLRATAWLIRERDPMSLPAVATSGPEPPPPPSQLPPDPFGAHRYRHYYADAQERRVIAGAFATPGP